jgi:peptidoglycan hydrolase-like protein with peptidoglycan-binding domain
MKRKTCVGVTRALAASLAAFLAVLGTPAASAAADSRADAADRASSVLARGAGYGQPQAQARVQALQRRLRALGYRPGPVDGLYGPRTEAAVERLQRDSGISVDGIVGLQTRRVLSAEEQPLAPGAGYGRPEGSPQVRAVQQRLRALGHRPGPVDGLYGPRTQAAVERFQRTTGQAVSGVLSARTAVALARADGGPPAGRASDARRVHPPRQQASRAGASGAEDRPNRAGGESPSAASAKSRMRTPAAGGDRVEETDGPESASPLLWVVLALALAGVGGLVAGWLRRRRRRPEESGASGGPVKPKPVPNGGGKAAKRSARLPSIPRPRRRARKVPALGYVTVRDREAADGRELRYQLASIDAACRQLGLILKDVIRDRERAGDTGAERPGVRFALQRLDAGEASCLVVAELARLGRSAPEIGSLMKSLRRCDARLVAVAERLDTGRNGGGEPPVGDAAEKPHVDRAANTASLRALNGDERPSTPPSHPGPIADAGPSETGGGSESSQTDDVSALEERIREMRASGMTLQAIADRLNAENVPTLRGGTKWRPSAVQAATGYRRPGPGAEDVANGRQPNRNGSSRGRRRRSRRPSSARTRGGRR